MISAEHCNMLSDNTAFVMPIEFTSRLRSYHGCYQDML
jgi:hypothetical protein